MVLPRVHRTSRHGLAWLLALALLLPLAQTVAAWHALTHFNSGVQASDRTARHAMTGLDCDLCVTAAALGSGALPYTPLLVPASLGDHRASFAAQALPVASPPSHYLSRAPPAASA